MAKIKSFTITTGILLSALVSTNAVAESADTNDATFGSARKLQMRAVNQEANGNPALAGVTPPAANTDARAQLGTDIPADSSGPVFGSSKKLMMRQNAIQRNEATQQALIDDSVTAQQQAARARMSETPEQAEQQEVATQEQEEKSNYSFGSSRRLKNRAINIPRDSSTN